MPGYSGFYGYSGRADKIKNKRKMDTKKLFEEKVNVPGKQRRVHFDTPSGDVVMLAFNLDRKRFKLGTDFWPTQRPKFMETLEQMYFVESVSRLMDGIDAAVICCECISMNDNESLQNNIRELVESTLQ